MGAAALMTFLAAPLSPRGLGMSSSPRISLVWSPLAGQCPVLCPGTSGQGSPRAQGHLRPFRMGGGSLCHEVSCRGCPWGSILPVGMGRSAWLLSRCSTFCPIRFELSHCWIPRKTVYQVLLQTGCSLQDSRAKVGVWQRELLSDTVWVAGLCCAPQHPPVLLSLKYTVL